MGNQGRRKAGIILDWHLMAEYGGFDVTQRIIQSTSQTGGQSLNASLSVIFGAQSPAQPGTQGKIWVVISGWLGPTL